MGEKCEKQKVYSGVFHATFFVFRGISPQGWHSSENSKDYFVVYFFAALIKHKICIKCEKCTASVSYFVVCFEKNTREMRKVYSRSYEEASLSAQPGTFTSLIILHYSSRTHKRPRGEVPTY